MNLLAVLVLKQIFPANVTLRMEAPAEVVAGSEFEVRIFINKGDLESFSRFQQVIPSGLTASQVESSNADFSFEDKRVRLIWLRLPRQEEFELVYRIKVDERLKGTFELKGKFSYIQDNERKSISVPEKSVYIQPSPTIDPALIVDISEFEEKVIQPIPHFAAGSENIACIRQKPYLGTSGNEYIVNLLINKENREKFAKIEEEVPPGFTASDIERKDAIFTFKNGTAKYLWMNLPQESFFMVTYRLIPTDPSKGIVPKLTGKFSFLDGEKTVVIDVLETDQDVKNLTRDQLLAMIPELKNKPAPVAIIPDETKEVTPVEVKVEEPVVEEKPGIEEKPLAEKKPQVIKSENNKTRDYKELKNNLPYLLEPESGIYYRVQLAAGHKPVDIKHYFKKFNLDREVRKEYHEGWHKYSVGSFNVYKEARDYRIHIWNSTDITDAFVSAYNDGKRITVQEALMIANQQWYK